MARKALGRGLDALIPAGDKGGKEGPDAPSGGGGLEQVRIGDISAGRYQPRQSFDQDKIAELAESIESQGILQPLLLRPRAKGGYELIAGERRLRAAKLLGMKTVPALVREVDDVAALELSLVENLQREDLDPIEEAEAFRRLINEFGHTQEELSKQVGKDRATISNQLRLLSLPEDIIEDVRAGLVTAGHARAILAAGSESAMRRLRDAVVKDGISVREAEARARGETGKKKARKGSSDRRTKDPNLREIEERLIRELGAKVRINKRAKGGRIEIDFFSREDLDRIYRKIVG